MSLLQRLFKPRTLSPAEMQKRGEELDRQRRHMRGRISKLTGEIQRAWTEFRLWRGDAQGRKALRSRIRELEGDRKGLVKEMLKIQSEMKRLGFQSAAGHVDVG